MVVVLVVITAISSAAVGAVFILTKEPIEAAKIAKTNSAIAEVMPSFDNNPSSDVVAKNVDGDVMKIYTAKMADKTVGYAIETFTNNGFGGKIRLMVGFTPEGKITKISVLEHKETPGLGDKIEPAKSKFSVQFEGADPSTMKLAVRKDKGDIDAITASTITSRAYIDAVERAYAVFKELN